MFIKEDYGTVDVDNSIIDFNYIYNKVKNNSHTYEILPYSSRTTLNEGGVYVDTTNKIAYLYCDFSTITSVSISGGWAGLLYLTPADTSVIPTYTNQADVKTLITKESTVSVSYGLYLYSTNVYIGTPTNLSSGVNSIVYGMWTLGK